MLKFPAGVWALHLLRKSTFLYMYFPVSTPIIVTLQVGLLGLWLANSLVRSRVVEKMFLAPDLLHIVNVYQPRGLVA